MGAFQDVLSHRLVRAADEFATSAHESVGQRQKYTSLPYSAHTRAVAALVAEFINRPECVAAAHLHDTLDDTGVCFDELARIFGVEVAELVVELSTQAARSTGNRAARVAAEAIRFAAVSSDAKSIKCADVVVNMGDIVDRDYRFARTYVPEKRLLLPSLMGAHPQMLALAHGAVAKAEAALKAKSARPHP